MLSEPTPINILIALLICAGILVAWLVLYIVACWLVTEKS
jgi:phage shock protein PspC (stress-responsive transcriptional regulator)